MKRLSLFAAAAALLFAVAPVRAQQPTTKPDSAKKTMAKQAGHAKVAHKGAKVAAKTAEKTDSGKPAAKAAVKHSGKRHVAKKDTATTKKP